ncbi:MAG: hypothetical protein RL557_605 [archaeon]|jgi:hypothetical protein
MNKIISITLVFLIAFIGGYFLFFQGVAADPPGGSSGSTMGIPCNTNYDCGAHQVNNDPEGVWIFDSCQKCYDHDLDGQKTCNPINDVLCDTNKDGHRCIGDEWQYIEYDKSCGVIGQNQYPTCSIKTDIEVINTYDCTQQDPFVNPDIYVCSAGACIDIPDNDAFCGFKNIKSLGDSCVDTQGRNGYCTNTTVFVGGQDREFLLCLH